ncbi:MAG: serine/threonine-protein kinase, partial [Planctomycetota bacterium]
MTRNRGCLGRDCPTEETLRDLIAGKLSEEASRKIESQIDACKSCQIKLIRLEPDADWRKRLPVLMKESPDLAGLDGIMTQVRALGQHKNGEGNRLVESSRPSQYHVDRDTLIDDGFELLERIGQGGMGVVYKAWEKSLNRFVAIKMLLPHLSNDKTARARFLREARSAASVVHTNVIAIHAVSERPPVPYIVMEFVEGISLQQQLDCGGDISLKNIVRIGLQVAAALQAAHEKGVIHRDIKPGNILVNAKSNKVQIGDFGLAQASGNSRLTRSGMLLGTPDYVAPEMVGDPDSADQRADLFSLGAVLYALCSGESPFHSETILETLRRLSTEMPQPLDSKESNVPPWLSDVILRCLSKEPDQRFQSANEIKRVLRSGDSGSISKSEQMQNTVVSPPVVNTMPAGTDGIVTQEFAGSAKRDLDQLVRKRKSTATRSWMFAGSIAVATSIIVLLISQIVQLAPAPDTDIISAADNPDVVSDAQERNLAYDRETASDDDQKEGLQDAIKPDGVVAEGMDAVKSELDDHEAEGTGLNEYSIRLTKKSGGSTAYSSLNEAIDAVDAGSVIEIQTSGVIECEPFAIMDPNGKSRGQITIKAADGYEPILNFSPTEEPDQQCMIHVSSNVKMDGLELRMTIADEDQACSIIGVIADGDLYISGCTLKVEGNGFCLSSEANVTISNSWLHAVNST